MLSFNTRFLPRLERRSITLSYTGTLPRILHFHTPNQLGNPSGSTYSLFRPTCLLFLCSTFLRFFTFSCSNYILRDFFTTLLSYIYLFGSILSYLRWKSLILYNRILSDEDNQDSPYMDTSKQTTWNQNQTV